MTPGSRTDERVALVAGATRGAGRAIAVELARVGFFVVATGRSSRISGPSEIGRPETIEERPASSLKRSVAPDRRSWSITRIREGLRISLHKLNINLDDWTFW